jgi:hypothetical protein
VVGTDVDDALLAEAKQFVADEALVASRGAQEGRGAGCVEEPQLDTGGNAYQHAV